MMGLNIVLQYCVVDIYGCVFRLAVQGHARGWERRNIVNTVPRRKRGVFFTFALFFPGKAYHPREFQD